MRPRLRIIVLLSLVPLWHFAQLTLELKVVSETNKPLAGVFVSCEGKTETTDGQGALRITPYRRGAALYLRKLGFRDTTLCFNSGEAIQTVVIALKYEPVQIDEVTVTSSRYQEVNPRDADFIIDFEIQGQSMVQLLSDDNLLLLDVNNQVTCRKKAPSGTESLCKDVTGTLHLITPRKVYRLYTEGRQLLQDSLALDPVKFNWSLLYHEAVAGDVLYLRRYKDFNQTVAFFSTSAKTGLNASLLKEISGEERRRGVEAHARRANSLVMAVHAGDEFNLAGDMGEKINTRQRRDAKKAVQIQEAFDKPSYNILRLVNDSLLLFAHDLDTLYTYDKRGNLVRRTHINYHHLKHWDSEIIVNEEKSRVFGKFVSARRIMIAEIDLLSGQLKFPFISFAAGRVPLKIRIRGNTVYYLGKQPGGTGNTVYAQEL